MPQFNPESTRAGTSLTEDMLTTAEILISIAPALVGMAVVGIIVILGLL